jgi:hypothetical protein
MVTLVIIKSWSIRMTWVRPLSHVYMTLSHTDECHLDCVMLQHHFKGIWWRYSLTWLRRSWKCSWMISLSKPGLSYFAFDEKKVCFFSRVHNSKEWDWSGPKTSLVQKLQDLQFRYECQYSILYHYTVSKMSTTTTSFQKHRPVLINQLSETY